MTIQDAKQIKLADYLQSLGYTPVKQQGRSLWYKSPLRNETDASFKVNTELNQWYDFGIGKGGNIIALAAELYHSENVAYLLERIAERRLTFARHHSLLASNKPLIIDKGWRVIFSCPYRLPARARNKHRTRQKRVQGVTIRV